MLWNSKWFPGTNLQDINLDWILKKISALRGGAAGQVLSKKTGTDFDFEWVSGGGGTPGATFIPSVSSAGVISWTNDGGLPNPDPVNIKGPRGNTGNTGATVPAGPGLPSGGEIGQIPIKKSLADFDTEWRYPLDKIQNVTTANEDLNSYTTGGYYYFQTTYTPLNKPESSGSYGFLIVLHGTTNARLTQIWVDTASNILYTRANSNSPISWSDWRRLSQYPITEGAPTIVETLPTGVTAAEVQYVQNGALVEVGFSVRRTSDAMNSYATIANGLPVPAKTFNLGGLGVPLAKGFVTGSQTGSPLYLLISSAGALRVARGETEGTYSGMFIYLTNQF